MNDGTKLEDMTWNEFLFGLPEPNPYTFPIQTMRWFAMRGLLLTKKIESLAIILAVLVFSIDFQERRDERIHRAWSLVAAAAQTSANTVTNDSKSNEPKENNNDAFAGIGNIGLGEALTLLKNNKQSLNKIHVPRSYLVEVDLVDASLIEADFSGADLYEANLFGADLRRADLSSADISYADLSFADLSNGSLCFWSNLLQGNRGAAANTPPWAAVPARLA